MPKESAILFCDIKNSNKKETEFWSCFLFNYHGRETALNIPNTNQIYNPISLFLVVWGLTTLNALRPLHTHTAIIDWIELEVLQCLHNIKRE